MMPSINPVMDQRLSLQKAVNSYIFQLQAPSHLKTTLNTVFNKKQLLFSLKNNRPEQSPLTITYRAKMTCLCVHSLDLLGCAKVRTVLYQWLNIA